MNQELDEVFMNEAISLAKQAREIDEVPVGAIIVHDNSIIAKTYNLKEANFCATDHAEMLCIAEASKALKRWRLNNCTLYVTLEPCIMCSGALIQSRIDKVVFGAKDPKGGGLVSLYRINEDSRLNHKFVVKGEVLSSECSFLLSSFFRDKRSASPSKE